MNDERLKRALGTIGDAAGDPSPWDDVIDTRRSTAPVTDIRRLPARRLLALAAGVAAVVGAVAVLSDDPAPRIAPADGTSTPPTPPDTDPSPTSSTPGPVTTSSGWRQVDDLPSGRTSPLVASIDGGIYVIGGRTSVCPPTGYCIQSPPELTDGHRLDGTGWEGIAPAPRPLDDGSPWSVSGGALFALSDAADDTPNADSSPLLVVYDPAADEWESVEVPMAATRDSIRLVVAGDDVLVVPVDDDLDLPTLRYDRGDDDWATLPADPLAPSTDRQMVAVGESLYLFGRTATGTSAPVSAAVLDGTTWRPLDGVPVGTTGPWTVIGATIVNSMPGCAERLTSSDPPSTEQGCTPSGGIFDTSTGNWSALPQPLDDETLRWIVLGHGDMTLAAAIDLAAGFAYDPTTAQWFDVDPVPADAFGVGTSSFPISAGRQIVRAGGYLFPESDAACEATADPFLAPCSSQADLLSEVWIWTPPTPGPEPAWRQLPDSPLSPRYGSVVQRVGDEIIVVGGMNHLCPPGADCALQPDDEFFADGAAYDLTTGRWRTIADAPGPTYSTTTVVLDEAMYLGGYDESTGEMTMDVWRYTAADDRWDVIPVDTVGDLVAVGDTLAVSWMTDERGTGPDQILDPETGEWTDLPDDPLGPSFDRTMVGAGDTLYLFAKDLVPSPGSGSVPSVARAARLDLTTMTWTVLPDSEILTTGPWLVAGDLLVNPSLGCADGGGNSYGRCVPMGGIVDTSTDTWRDLPPLDGLGDEPYGEDGLALAAAGAVSAATYELDRGFWVLDTDRIDEGTAAWAKVLWPTDDQDELVVAGRDLVIVGGQSWSGGTGRLLDDVWIWQSP